MPTPAGLLTPRKPIIDRSINARGKSKSTAKRNVEVKEGPTPEEMLRLEEKRRTQEFYRQARLANDNEGHALRRSNDLVGSMKAHYLETVCECPVHLCSKVNIFRKLKAVPNLHGFSNKVLNLMVDYIPTQVKHIDERFDISNLSFHHRPRPPSEELHVFEGRVKLRKQFDLHLSFYDDGTFYYHNETCKVDASYDLLPLQDVERIKGKWFQHKETVHLLYTHFERTPQADAEFREMLRSIETCPPRWTEYDFYVFHEFSMSCSKFNGLIQLHNAPQFKELSSSYRRREAKHYRLNGPFIWREVPTVHAPTQLPGMFRQKVRAAPKNGPVNVPLTFLTMLNTEPENVEAPSPPPRRMQGKRWTRTHSAKVEAERENESEGLVRVAFRNFIDSIGETITLQWKGRCQKPVEKPVEVEKKIKKKKKSRKKSKKKKK